MQARQTGNPLSLWAVCVMLTVLLTGYSQPSVASRIYSCVDSMNGTVLPGAGQCTSDIAVSTGATAIAFCSAAGNLVRGDTNSMNDIFVRYPFARITQRVSISSTGVQANGDSYSPAISANGRFVAFSSGANNLVPSDRNNTSDVFVYDIQLRQVKRVSVGPNKVEANGYSSSPSISADGRYIAFSSSATNLDRTGRGGVFVYDQYTGTTFRASYDLSGNPIGASDPAISGNGRCVAYSTYSPSIGAYILLRDLNRGVTEPVSVSSSGVLTGGDSVFTPSLSYDGRYVVFPIKAVLIPGVSPIAHDATIFNLYLRDRVSRKTELVNVSSSGKQGLGDSITGSISSDGRYVVFSSDAENLVMNDHNNTGDVYIRDRWNNRTSRISITNSGGEANGYSYYPAIDPGGNWVAFMTNADNLLSPDANGSPDIVLTYRYTTTTMPW